VVAALVVAVGAGAFALGRHSAPSRYEDGYLAGRYAAFGGYDGGWGYGEPYAIVLRRGGPQVTYAIARRWPMLPGFEYRACGRSVCARKAGSG
jgi:hypothetical protein